MKLKHTAMAAALTLALVGCNNMPSDTAMHPVNQKALDTFASSAQLTFEVIDNNNADFCDKEIDGGNCVKSVISITAEKNFMASGWEIYFSQVHPVESVDSDLVTMEHITGDMHVIRPTDKFTGIKAGETLSIPYVARNWYLSESDLFPNYFIVGEGLEARVIDSTREQVDPETGLLVSPFIVEMNDYEKHIKRTVDDKTPQATAGNVYAANADLKKDSSAVASAIVPTPKMLKVDATKTLDLSAGIKVSLTNVERADVAAALARLDSFGIEESRKGVDVTVEVRANATKGDGSYQLVVGDNNITILAGDASGAFYGLQSLAALVTVGNSQVPTAMVEDAPYYDFRGMHVDVSRNFRSKEFILSLLDQMAAYKLNKFHFHLGDDEGWRLEVKDLPELTDFGSKRCWDPEGKTCLEPMLGAGAVNEGNVNNGYYSIDDYLEIVRYAQARHIQVIPSLDMPAHARAAVKAMQLRYHNFMAAGDEAAAKEYLLTDFDNTSVYSTVQYYGDNTINACMDSSYNFIDKVMDEVKALHDEAGQPLTRYHIGADEAEHAWDDSPACHAFLKDNPEVKDVGSYFIERVAGILAEKGIESGGWSDGISHTQKDNMPETVQANSWVHLAWGGTAVTNDLTNRGWDMVLSTPDVLYFDFPYAADSKENGYYWAARAIDTRKIFEFQPDNLPVHAEFWPDRQGMPFTIDDTHRTDKDGKKLGPLKKGMTFAGIQGQLWSETTRSDDTAEYKMFPRLLAVAERAWHPAKWAVPYNYDGAIYNKDSGTFTSAMRADRDAEFNDFSNVLGQKELAKLDVADVAYRIPTVGAVVESGKLHANVIFPGLGIEYRVDGGKWMSYSKPVAVKGDVEVRALSADGKRPGRSLKVN